MNRRHDLVGKGFLGTDVATAVHHVLGHGDAGEAGETLGAATARNQTELDFGHAHAAVLGDHAEVGRDGDFEAATERKAVDG